MISHLRHFKYDVRGVGVIDGEELRMKLLNHGMIENVRKHER